MAPVKEIGHSSPKKIIFEWTSDADGKASGVTTNFYSGEIQRIKITHDPISPPIAAYDVFINDDDGDDLACEALKDIAPVETKILSSTQCILGAVAESRLNFTISGAGGANRKGKIMVFLR